MSDREFIRVPVALYEACQPSAPALAEVEALADLCQRFWYGEQASRTGLQRGETRATLGQLASAWGWRRQRVRHFLARLERTGQIATKSEGRCTLISCAQLAHNLRTKSAQPAHNESEEKQQVADGSRTSGAQTAHKPRTTCARYQERDRETERQEEQIDPVATLQDLANAGASALPSSAPDTGQAVEPTRHDLATKAGRSRAFPTLSALPKQGARYDYPESFDAFRSAYPNSAKRAPGPATYKDWRKLVVDGIAPESLLRAAKAYAATVGEPRYARRAHGPSGWLLAGDWEAHADAPTNAGASQHTKPDGQQDRWREIASRHDLSTEEGQAAALSEGFGGLRIMRGGEFNDDEIDF